MTAASARISAGRVSPATASRMGIAKYSDPWFCSGCSCSICCDSATRCAFACSTVTPGFRRAAANVQPLLRTVGAAPGVRLGKITSVAAAAGNRNPGGAMPTICRIAGVKPIRTERPTMPGSPPKRVCQNS